IQALLLRRNRGKGATPLFLNGRRGRLVGAYQLQKLCLLPIGMVVPVSEGWMLPTWWPPLFAAAGSPFTIIGFPVMLGFSDFMLSQFPEQKAKTSAAMLLKYSALLFILAIISKWSLIAGAMMGLCALFGPILLNRWNHWREWKASPLFVQ